MSKKIINMMSSATKVSGQGVGSAYLEQVDLVKTGLSEDFEVTINQYKPADITHYHTIDPQFYLTKPWFTRKGMSVGYVHMLPETVEQSLQLPGFAKKIFYKYMIAFYKKMDYLVTVNPYFIGELARYGVPKEKVTYIPNFVSSQTFHPLTAEEKAANRDQYGFAQADFLIVGVGQIQTRKGVFDFLKMAERLPHYKFVWAGGFSFGKITDGYEELKKVVDNPPANVTFLGIVERERMNAIYNLADVMILPSFEELFPMSILEAMCTHKPILLRDLEIYEDILFDFYRRAEDLEGFVDQIEKLATDSNYYQQAVADAQRGNEFYSREHVLEMWQEFYEKVSPKKD
ncbi:glycosyltransferase family 4 protein [Streptococcus gallolyticus]|uniref:glycosyltransferase family 4 protein n=1 Tax=Streptococcus hepaticus TaxID=3349163 RepID=UPI001C946E5D|nr:glycosyltransferase family 4 protein [Streptococcus gallolyticus]MBY5040406.1 glycosyltransferase family 4 protein [Streptococcus gallolyticus]